LQLSPLDSVISYQLLGSTLSVNKFQRAHAIGDRVAPGLQFVSSRP